MLSSRRRLTAAATGLLIAAPIGAGCGGGGEGSSSAASSTPPVSTRPTSASADRALDRLERRYAAHVGVYARDTASGRTVAYHADRRFAYASTYKVLAVGALLHIASDRTLNRTITYSPADLQEWSPITSKHVTSGMTLRAVMAAALRYSDNTAANLLLEQLGGPSALQRALRQLGDTTTHVDRTEPTVNTAVPGDVRDTSTPRALAADLQRFALGDMLSAGRRRMLDRWLRQNTTGDRYIRAGVPDGWTVGDKTGNGYDGTRNDIAVVRPPHGAPIVIAVFTRRGGKNAASDDALIADAARVTLHTLRGTGSPGGA